ncbi:MAG TPA: YkgJ family cysteine cluster protein [Thermoanaerobaculia bacterium]|nr:YkgJ family cysteine cluster protein [Thermoanaerobaculia bacterium]
MNPEVEPVDGSRLCLACGLCCQGLLHDWARLRDGEVEAAERLGLSTEVQKGETAFSLPCPNHQDGCCTIYQERLSPCREYRCKLLRGYLDGRVTWEEGLRRVEQAKRLIAAIRVRLGAPKAAASVWQQLRDAETGPAASDPDLCLEVAALLAHCQRHFWTRAEPKRTFRP